MSESQAPTPLTDQALAKLRKLGEGNHVPPDKIELLGTEEQIFTLKGTLTLAPKCNIETGRYTGPARGGKNRKVFPDLDTMHTEVAKFKNDFETGRSWFESAMQELQRVPGQGWGADGARITLPEQTIVYTASTACTSCAGQRMVTCRQCGGAGTFTCGQCGGSRHEVCYACSGSGNNPQNPAMRCAVCGGNRMTACRRCGGSGQSTCPTCNGQRGVPCPTCQGSGFMSEEVGIECGIETHFKLETEGLPSGMRNGIGRLGLDKMANGHADITLLPQEEKKPEDEENDPDHYSFIAQEKDRRKIIQRELKYEARLPYADLRMNLNGSKAVVTVFGKRGGLLNVPPFLDKALEPARTQLKTGDLDGAMETRAVADAVQLELSGKGNAQEMRRLYPSGLSPNVMQEILQNLRASLKQYTLIMRSIAAVICGFISTGFFAVLFLTNLHAQITQGWPMAAQAAFDLFVAALPMAGSYFALNLATKWRLQQKFHSHAISLKQPMGKTGYALMAVIAVVFVAIALLTPVKPAWITLFVR